MPAPDFVLALRERVGHELLWMPGITAVVVDASGERVLLVRRSDTGNWAPVTGIVDPGEQPAQCAVREVQEETCVEAVVERLVAVEAEPVTVHVNGDRAQYLDLAFRCRHVRGEPRVGDDESTDVRWFAAQSLPDLGSTMRHRVERALAPDGPPWFAR